MKNQSAIYREMKNKSAIPFSILDITEKEDKEVEGFRECPWNNQCWKRRGQYLFGKIAHGSEIQ